MMLNPGNKPYGCRAAHLAAVTRLACGLAVVTFPIGVSAQTAATPTTTGGGPGVVAPAVVTLGSAINSPYENLRIKGLDLPLPAPADTVTGEAGGLRAALASIGVGWFGFVVTPTFYNVLDAQRGPTQSYAGQKFTAEFGTPFFLTYDLSRIGIPNAQLVAGAQWFAVSWNPGGPNTFSLATLSYYQSLFNKHIEYKIGYLANSYEYYNAYIGGNLAAGIFGSSSSIPTELGLSSTVFAKPGANIKLNWGPFYNKSGIQAAISPDGTVREKSYNPSATKWDVNHAGNLYISEFGYQVPSSPTQNQAWYRAAYLRSTSDYQNIKTGTRSTGNWAFYALGDQQIIRLGHTKKDAARGVYTGFSVMYSPPYLNRFAKYFEARAYAVGLFPSRPRDMISLIAAYNVFGANFVESVQQAGGLAHHDSKALTLAYNLHLSAGFNFGFGAAYVDNPTPISYKPKTASALNLIGDFVVYY